MISHNSYEMITNFIKNLSDKIRIIVIDNSKDLKLRKDLEKSKNVHFEFMENKGYGSAINFARKNKTSPTIIISHTMKGKGVSFMEEVPTWHGSLELSNDDLRKSLTELGCSESKIEEYIIK